MTAGGGRVATKARNARTDLTANARRRKLTDDAGAKPFIKDDSGAIYVEFLISFFPVFIFFMCMFQLSLLYAAKLVVEHSAQAAARGLGLALAEQGDVPTPQLNVAISDKQRGIVRKFALSALAPLIQSDSIDTLNVVLPDPTKPGSPQDYADQAVFRFMLPDSVQLVRARVETTVKCKVPLVSKLMCESSGGVPMQAEAVFPSQRNAYIPTACN